MKKKGFIQKMSITFNMDLNTLKEYINIHLISIRQDFDKCQHDYIYQENDEVFDKMVRLSGQIEALEHILEVANGK